MLLKIKHFTEVTSTMDAARDIILKGDGEPNTIVLADQQTGGRGRFNRTWISPPGNLYMSLIVEDEFMNRLSQFALMWGVILRESLAKYVPKKLQCKWPNDILLEGKKVAGILIEKVDHFLIVGIGINIASSPEYVTFPATHLSLFIDPPAPGELAQTIGETYLNICQKDFDAIREDWLESAWRLGEQINIRQDDRSVVGIFETIDEAGALILENHPQKYYTGDVFIGVK